MNFGYACRMLPAIVGLFSMSWVDVVQSAGITKTDNPVEGSYIVITRHGIRTSASSIAAQYGASVESTYTNVLEGFSASMSEDAALALSEDESVLEVVQNGIVTTDQTVTWGMDRSDQPDLPLDGSYNPGYGNGGSGVTAYIIDTGIRISHSDFGNRARWGINTTGDNNNSDCNGHGTHVAGTVGGSTVGIAKNVDLVAVKVLSCSGSGTWNGVIQGMDFVAGDKNGPATANMSLGGGANSAVDTALNNLVAAGVTVVTAAGNSNTDSCTFSPARASGALNVASSTSSDASSSFSNYGSCVDIFAPGSNVYSAWYTSDSAYATLSGTSMAAPHVCGATALYLNTNTGASPQQVENYLLANSTPDRIANANGSPNKLLYVGSGGSPTPPSPTPPSPTPPSPTPPSPTPPSPTPKSGSFQIQAEGTNDCIEVSSMASDSKISVSTCDRNSPKQLFEVDDYGHISMEDDNGLCIKKVRRNAKLTNNCGSEFSNKTTMWVSNSWDGAIHLLKNGLFVLERANGKLKVGKRNTSKNSQVWELVY